MRICLMTDAFADRPLAEVIGWIGETAPAITDVEIGTGAYSPAPHCDLDALLADGEHRARWLATLNDAGLRLAALNVSGNPLHPTPSYAAAHDRELRDTIRLAALLGVDRIVAMSGCPGAGPEASSAPHFAAGGWLPDFEDIAEWQWTERVLPYWSELSAFARAEHPDLQLCFELHPGATVFNVPTYERIRPCGDNLKVNMDPSHLFWEGMDALAVIEACGPDIGFVHAKDTAIAPAAMALVGNLDPRIPGDPEQSPWNYVTLGHGQPPAWWARFVEALAAVGYDGALSMEYEDPFVAAEASVLEGTELLSAILSPSSVAGEA